MLKLNCVMKLKYVKNNFILLRLNSKFENHMIIPVGEELQSYWWYVYYLYSVFET